MNFYPKSSGLSSGGVRLGWQQPQSLPQLGAPTNAEANNVGKFNIDITNPVGSVGQDVSSAAGFIGGLPGGNILGGLVGGAAGAAAGIAGNVGNFGIPGTDIGVKQGLGAAGEVVAGPGNWLQTQAAMTRLSRATGKPGPSGLGGLIGEVLAGDQVELPADLQLQLDQGVPLEHIANELVDRNAGYTSNPTGNLLLSIALDPFNFIGLGLGKAVGVSQKANQAVRIAEDAGKYQDVQSGTRVLAKMYDTMTVGLGRKASATMGQFLGPVTDGTTKFFGPTLDRTLSGLRKVDPASADRLSDVLGIAQGNHGLSVVIGDTVKGFRKGLAVIADRPVKAESEIAQLHTAAKFSKKQLASAIFTQLERHVPLPVGTPEELATQAVSMLREAGISEDVAAQIVGQAASPKMWQLAYEARYGAAIRDFTAAQTASLGSKAIDAQRLTLVNPQNAALLKSISQDLERLSEVSVKGARAKAESVIKDILSHNEDAAAAFSGKKLKVKTLVNFLEKQKSALPEIVPWGEGGAKVHELPSALRAFREKWGQLGYQLGFAPADGYVTAVVDGEAIIIRPWTPLVSESIGLAQRNPIGRVYDALFGGINQGRIISEATRRFVAGTAKYGITEPEARAIVDDVIGAARKISKTPRAAYSEFDSIFEHVIGPSRLLALKKSGAMPAFLINQAFEGNWRTVGLTQKATGVVKTLATGYTKGGVAGKAGEVASKTLTLGGLGYNWPVKLAEKIYPMVKFEYRPLFTVQELVEQPTYNRLRGIGKVNISPEMQTFVDALVTHNAGAKYVLEAGWETQMGAFRGTEMAFGEGSRFASVAGKVLPDFKSYMEGGLQKYGKTYMIRQIVHYMPNEFRDAVMQASPKAWGHWIEKLGTDDPRVITQAFLKERLTLIEGQKGLDFEMAALRSENAARIARGEASLLPTVEDQVVANAFEYAMRKASTQAYKTHFYNPSRGWLERTLNHPYLGLYPLSYMWGKVVPEFTRFLVLEPFGRKAPLVGYEAMQHVQQAIANQMDDPEFARSIDKFSDTIYLMQLLLPATFSDIPVNAPAWARHLSASNQGGKKFNLGTEAQNTVQHLGLFGDIPTVQQGLAPLFKTGYGSVQDQLDRAARQFDGMFPSR
jgi:hypothetical protein